MFSGLSNWRVGCGFFMTYLSIGRSFEYIKDNYGIISAIIGHIGMNLALIILIAKIYYDNSENYIIENLSDY